MKRRVKMMKRPWLEGGSKLEIRSLLLLPFVMKKSLKRPHPLLPRKR
jgi:hypothetical protein